MNLLLLLSAILSALTGVGATGHAPRAAVAVAQASEAGTPSRVAIKGGGERPSAVLPRLRDLMWQVRPAFRLAAFLPLFLSRRRE